MQRKVFATLAIIFGLFVAIIEPANAARLTEQCGCVDPIDNSVLELFAAYPQGGAELANAIDELLQSNPELGDDVICASQNKSAAQQAAAAAGYAHAQLILASSGAESANDLAEAVRCGDLQFRAAYDGAQNAYAFVAPGTPVNAFIPRIFGAGFGGGVVSEN